MLYAPVNGRSHHGRRNGYWAHARREKAAGIRVLKAAGLNASQAINLLFDRLAEAGNADFLTGQTSSAEDRWEEALRFVDSIPRKRASQFDSMSKTEAKLSRLATHGLTDHE